MPLLANVTVIAQPAGEINFDQHRPTYASMYIILIYQSRGMYIILIYQSLA